MRKIILTVSLFLLSPFMALADMADGQNYGMMSGGNMMSWGGMMGGGAPSAGPADRMQQMEKRMEEIKQMAGKDILMQLLPLIDQFQLALQSMNERTSPKDLMKGMELIYAQLNALLEQNNVQPIPTESVAFDPYYHEVMLKQESDEEEGIVLEELQKGYMFKDKVLRYSKVKVSEKKVEKNQTDEKNTAK